MVRLPASAARFRLCLLRIFDRDYGSVAGQMEGNSRVLCENRDFQVYKVKYTFRQIVKAANDQFVPPLLTNHSKFALRPETRFQVEPVCQKITVGVFMRVRRFTPLPKLPESSGMRTYQIRLDTLWHIGPTLIIKRVPCSTAT